MKEYDLHLAAASISRETVERLSQIGFERDQFANLTHCHTGDYHGTFKGGIPIPNKNLWEKLCCLLTEDERFSGYMEEEATSEEWRKNFNGSGSATPGYLPPMKMIACPAGRRKACDIHMSVYLGNSSQAVIEHMEQLGASSVDRPGPEGIRRVFTITCETNADGRRLFQALSQHLSTIAGLHGRMKLEVTTKHFRKPDDAVTLPLATEQAVNEWFDAFHSRKKLAAASRVSKGLELAHV